MTVDIRARVDVVVLIPIIERGSFIRVRYASAQYTDAGHFCSIGYTNTTDIVLDSGNLACAACSVLIV